MCPGQAARLPTTSAHRQDRRLRVVGYPRLRRLGGCVPAFSGIYAARVATTFPPQNLSGLITSSLPYKYASTIKELKLKQNAMKSSQRITLVLLFLPEYVKGLLVLLSEKNMSGKQRKERD